MIEQTIERKSNLYPSERGSQETIGEHNATSFSQPKHTSCICPKSFHGGRLGPYMDDVRKVSAPQNTIAIFLIN